MKRVLTLFLSTAAVIGCASKHPGNLGQSLGHKKQVELTVSGKSVDPDVGSPFQLVEVTLENTSADWIRVARAEIVVDDPSITKVSTVMGSDLESWLEAKRSEDQLRNHNTDMALLGIAAVGVMAAASTKGTGNSGLAEVGLGTAVGAAVASDVRAYNEKVKSVESASKVPSTHLYYPFSIPGKMFQRRWLLLNKPVGTLVDNLVVEFETVEGKREKYAIKM